METSEAESARVALQSLAEAMPSLVWILTGDLRLEYANERFRLFTGLADQALRAHEQREALVHPDDRPIVGACMKAIASGAPFDGDVRVRRADGAYRTIALRVAPMGPDAGGRWIVTGADVEDERRSEALLLAITESAPQLIWVLAADGTTEFWNERLRRYTGNDRMDWLTIIHPDDAAPTLAAFDAARKEERAFEARYRLRRADGTHRWFLGRAEPARDRQGRIVRWVGTATDIDENKRTEDATALLLDASAALAGRRDIDVVLDDVCALATRDFAGACAVLRRGRDGALEHAASCAHDPRRAELLRTMLRMYPPRDADPAVEAMERTAPIHGVVDDAVVARIAHDPRHLAMLHDLGPQSFVDVPLIARGEGLGAISFIRLTGDRPFDERDVATATILADRVAGAIDEALTRASERRLAETFQASALPRRLPDLPGIEVRAIYQAAALGINVGGDWYDAFELSPWRLVVSIGDVAGKGVDAAATMSLIRHGIRFAAHRGQDPADILGVVDNALRAESPDLTATAFVAIVDIRESRVRYATAGHPPAALRLPNGWVRLLSPDPAPPLGTWPDGLRPRVEVSPLVYGSLLVLYTDGLTEVDRRPIEGEKRLVSALRDDAAFASTNPARFVRDVMIGDREVRDDVAVITLAYGRRRGWAFEAPDAMRAQPARASFERFLDEEAEGDIYGSALIFGELVGNVVRHAPGPIEMRAEWRQEHLVLHVFDSGAGFGPAASLPDASAEGGRGLFIVQTLARDVAVSPTARGTRVSVTLPVMRRVTSGR